MFVAKYMMTTAIALLTLTLFDSNPWWIVVVFSILITAVNFWLVRSFLEGRGGIAAFTQGIIPAFLAYVVGLTPFFRTTLGTLIGFALLLALGEFLLNKFLTKQMATN